MKPVKIKILKRSWTADGCGGYEACIPSFKKTKKTEKENNSSKSKSNTSKSKISSKNKVLEESPLLNTKMNQKNLSSDSSSDETDGDDLDDMFLQLKENGVKTVKTRNIRKETPSSKRESIKSDTKNVLEAKIVLSPLRNRNTKKNLLKNFESPDATNKHTHIDLRRVSLVPELEKLPEDLILHYKRTPKKIIDNNFEMTPEKKDRVETPLRRSSRRSSTLSKEEFIQNLETTPIRKNYRTPKKNSSTKKKVTTEPRTPTCKLEEKLPTTPLEKARLSLHVSKVPDGLPCREKEYNNILNFLENKLWDGIGGCMYISGVPGTGKTATVTQVIRHLQTQAELGKVPDFNFVEINGMRLSDPRQVYIQLWRELMNRKDRITSDRAQKSLDDWFCKNTKKSEKKTTVLLVDELDLICTKKQDVVYNLLDWPTRTHSRLVVLTIANTMDMPERLFKGRITSRMGLTRLTFMPYTYKQLEEIVLARLKGLDVFVTDAVRLVSRKVAAVSGDARRALDICRRATELPGCNDKVKISHIEQAIKEMTNSNIVKVIRNCGKLEKLFLQALCDISFRSNIDEVDLLEVIDQLLATCVLEGIPRPSVSSILVVSNRLKCSRLIFTNQSSGGILQRVMLNVTQDDIHYALQI